MKRNGAPFLWNGCAVLAEYAVISKEELLEKLWNDKYYIDENVLLVNMTRLKKKMKEIGIVHLLENIRGKGWKL